MRWLQTQNRIEEMAKILSKVAKSNGKALPSSVKEALLANTKIDNKASKLVITNNYVHDEIICTARIIIYNMYIAA